MSEQTIIWDADERELPGHGVVTKGSEVTLPKSLATSFLEQGLAVKPKPSNKEKTK